MKLISIEEQECKQCTEESFWFGKPTRCYDCFSKEWNEWVMAKIKLELEKIMKDKE